MSKVWPYLKAMALIRALTSHLKAATYFTVRSAKDCPGLLLSNSFAILIHKSKFPGQRLRTEGHIWMPFLSNHLALLDDFERFDKADHV